MATTNVSLTAPTDYGIESASLERRRRLAELLQAQSMAPQETQVVGGWAIPQSPMQGFSRMAQALVAGAGMRSVDERQRELAAKVREDRAQTVARAMQAGEAQPERFAGDQSSSEDSLYTPARAADSSRTYAILAGSQYPELAKVGIEGSVNDMRRRELVRMLGGGQPPGGGGAPAGGPTTASAGPSGRPPGFGGPAGGQPMEVWLQIDPTGAAYVKQLAADFGERNKIIAGRPGAPMVRGDGSWVGFSPALPQGMVTSETGQVSVAPGFQQSLATLNNTPNPSAPPVRMPMSGGQEVLFSQPEYLEYQRTGTLPARLGGIPPEGTIEPGTLTLKDLPPGERDTAKIALDLGERGVQHSLPVASAPGATPSGPGTPGMTRSPAATARDEAVKAANTEASKEFIKEMRENYSKLRDVPATLANIERAKATVPDARPFVGPLADQKLAVTKFFRSIGFDVAVDSVSSAEQLRAQLFTQVMDNLKKMDSQPSQYQQMVMQDAMGTLGTDPASIPKLLDVFGDLLRNRVDIHNSTVDSAETRGTAFPYDVRVMLPKRDAQPAPAAPVAAPAPKAAAPKVRKFNPATGRIE